MTLEDIQCSTLQRGFCYMFSSQFFFGEQGRERGKKWYRPSLGLDVICFVDLEEEKERRTKKGVYHPCFATDVCLVFLVPVPSLLRFVMFMLCISCVSGSNQRIRPASWSLLVRNHCFCCPCRRGGGPCHRDPALHVPAIVGRIC
jgi:hypothetical protein